MMLVLMELFAVGVGFLISLRLPLRSNTERFAVASALGLAFVLWLPYLFARILGLDWGVWISFGLMAAIACIGLAWMVSEKGNGRRLLDLIAPSSRMPLLPGLVL